MSDSKVSKLPLDSILKNLLLLSVAIFATGIATFQIYIATFSRPHDLNMNHVWAAIAIVHIGTTPPLLFYHVVGKGIAAILATSAWRFAMLVPFLAISNSLEGEQRNCFVIVMLACYFIALVLESWLLIRQLREVRAQH